MRTPRLAQRAKGTGTIARVRHSHLLVAYAPRLKGEPLIEVARSPFRFRLEAALDAYIAKHGKAA